MPSLFFLNEEASFLFGYYNNITYVSNDHNCIGASKTNIIETSGTNSVPTCITSPPTLKVLGIAISTFLTRNIHNIKVYRFKDNCTSIYKDREDFPKLQ